MRMISLTIVGGILFGCAIGTLAAQSDLFRLRVALTAPLVDVDGTLNDKYRVEYLLDNASCIVMIVDKADGTVAGITQVNKASCNKLSSQ